MPHINYKVDWYPEKFIYDTEQKIIEKLDDIGDALVLEAKLECPVDTGRLVQSIHKETDRQAKIVRVGSDVYYAYWVETGTRYHPPNPFLRRALDKVDQIIKFVFNSIAIK